MRLAFVTSLALVASFAVACGTTDAPIAPPGATETPDPGRDDPSGGEPGEGPEDAPHALGTITLGEAHAAGGGDASPIVSVSFVPDASKARACQTKLEGCEITALPKCDETTSFTGCGVGEACAWDDACKPACKPIPECAEACDDDEVCALRGSTGNEGECTKRESFDAGPIAFSGTTTPITLYPPYAFEGDGKGAPFLAGSELRVQAQGAAASGFEAFDETFTATSFIQTTPTLNKIERAAVFGPGPLRLAWVPGSDTVVVTLAGAGGSARCEAKDSSGAFDVPRAVIDRVLTGPDGEPDGALSVSVARARKEIKKGKKAKGSLAGVASLPEGWLELVTTSIESASFQGCGKGLSACGDACVDLKTDEDHCGACGKACPGAQSCVAGKCAAACEQGPENTLARCSDGCSNDGDPYVDCDDFNCCSVRNDCPPTTACGKQ